MLHSSSQKFSTQTPIPQSTMSKVPLPRFSNLGTPGVTNPGDSPTTWEGLYKSAHELKQIRDAVFPLLEENKQGFVSLNVRPALFEIQKELERAASKQFGLLGRLALCKRTPEECGTELLPIPAMVLAFAVHSAILNAGFVCTGSSTSEFSETESWPNVLPPGWLDDSGMKYSFRYRARSGASDKLIWKAVVMSDLLAISANDPYSTGKDAMTMHLRIKDFVKSKPGEPPLLVESKEKELYSVIEERIIPIGIPRRLSPHSDTSPNYFVTNMPVVGGGGARSGREDYNDPLMVGPGGFGGDLMPGVGGSMLFGPGNPQFDGRFRPMDPRASDLRRGGGRVPEARYDPYGPFGVNRGDPDPDDFPMPGARNPMGSGFPTGPVGPRRSNLDFL